MDKKIEDVMNEVIKEAQSNVIPFKPQIITGGIGGDGPWLLDQPEGAMIVCKEMLDERMQPSRQISCPVFTILHKTDKSVRLVNPQRGFDDRVEPTRFCARYNLIEILCIVDLNSIMKEDTNDSEQE